MFVRHYGSADLFITFTFNSKTNENVFEIDTYRVIPYKVLRLYNNNNMIINNLLL